MIFTDIKVVITDKGITCNNRPYACMLNLFEEIVISVFVKYIDRNLRDPTGTPHVKKSSYWP